MKNQLLTFILLLMVFPGFAQLTLESSANLIVESGSTVIVTGGIVNNSGTIDNKGTIENKGDLVNNTSTLFATTSTGTFKFNGTTAQEITGNFDAGFYGITEIDNTNGVSITTTSTGADQTINGELKFTSGTLTLNGFNLTLGSTDPTGTGASAYVVTNGTGTLKRNVPADGATNVTFPVGNTAYNPLALQNSTSATTDTYGVRVMDNEPANASTIHMVDRNWEVTETTSGGSDLTVTAQWNSTEELTGFDVNNCAIGLTTDGGTIYDWSETGAASGTDPYTMTASSFTGVGTFAVGDYFYSGKRLDLTFFLGGAYNGSNMNNDLYTSGVLLTQTTDPYGLGTTVASVPTNAIDWVEVQLRDNTDNTVVQHSYAFFVDASGNLLNTDGTTGGKITGAVLQNYYVAVLHRNHLGVVSNALVPLNTATPAYDFTTSQSSAWQDVNITTNAAMKDVNGTFVLWEGDATNDGTVAYNGAGNDRLAILTEVGSSTPGNTINNTYSDNDVNMDGNVIYNGAGSDRIIVLTIVGSSTPGVVYTQHLPY